MQIDADVSLIDCNTLRLPARARHFARVTSLDELREGVAFCDARRLPLLLLGGGSNVVLSDDLAACVLRMEIRGTETLAETATHRRVRVAAGEDWHGFVLACHARGWHGLENLALIPGTVGAAPIQNIGAYGVEVATFIESVTVLDRRDGRVIEVDAAACDFAYRDSRFKREPDWLIVAVTFALPQQPQTEAGYAALREELAGIDAPGPADVLRAVIAIRRRKLPDPAVLPNVGSFFKNPVVDATTFARLQARFPAVVHWPQGDAVKLAAGWLVDQCGWRGTREGDVGVHAQQALVLLNHGRAHAADVLRLAARIAGSVRERFGVGLEIEPRVC